jgi:hypothetical protein
MSNISAAHVRLGSNAGIGQKPDDWRTVPLCDGVNADGLYACHKRQHVIGEKSFWKDTDVEALIREFIKASPKRREIEQEMQERGIA